VLQYFSGFNDNFINMQFRYCLLALFQPELCELGLLTGSVRKTKWYES
jgi:hypothetical protein